MASGGAGKFRKNQVVWDKIRQVFTQIETLNDLGAYLNPGGFREWDEIRSLTKRERATHE